MCFILESQQQYHDFYPPQRYRYGGPRSNRTSSYRYSNNNNPNEYYQDNYGNSGQSQQISTNKPQQNLSNNGVNSNDITKSETINGGGPQAQRISKQQSNGVK